MARQVRNMAEGKLLLESCAEEEMANIATSPTHIKGEIRMDT